MSIEHAIIARSQPYIINQQLTDLVKYEVLKGCSAEILPQPVDLEPPHLNYTDWINTDKIHNTSIKTCSPWGSNDIIRLNCLIATEHDLKWFRAERFLKELQNLNHRVGFEIIGNQDQIRIGFMVHRSDLDLLKVAFKGEYQASEIIEDNTQSIFSRDSNFYDFLPPPPYHHLLTQSPELLTSPYDSLIYALAELPTDQTGFVQVLFKPVKNNWHSNVEMLTDMEYLSKTLTDVKLPFRVQQQVPSGDIKHMAQDVDTKAHNDKPFYFTALRVGLQSDTKVCPRSIASFVNLFQHGGKPLGSITEEDYANQLKNKQIQDMFYRGLVYRPGFLLNSAELSGLVHLPGIKEFKEQSVPLEIQEKLTIPLNISNVKSGLEIGSGFYKGAMQPVYINDTLRKISTHIVGRPGTGKTTTMEHMVLQDIEAGRGLAFIDPHGDSVKRLLHLIPENKTESTIYLDFGDPDWVPLWNPLVLLSGQSIGRTADDLVVAIKSIVQRHAWGDRLEHLLRNGFFGLLHLNDATFFDLLKLFEPRSKKSNQEKDHLKNSIINRVNNEVARIFWERDYDTYRREDFNPPLHKLSKLLTSDETVSLMLTQPSNRINFNDIMNSGKVLLLDLSNLGPDTKKILGCFLLSFLHNTLLARNKSDPDNRRTFSIYCDEAHKLTTDTLENILAESRKFGVNLTLAHQYLNQFNISQRDALTSVGTTIIFNVDINDARYLVKDLQEKVLPKDLAILETGEAIVRLGTDIIKIKTPKPKIIPAHSFRDRIIQISHENYCKTFNEVRNLMKSKNGSFSKLDDTSRSLIKKESTNSSNASFIYDEFD